MSRLVLVLAIGVFIGGPLSFVWYAFDEDFWWVPMAAIAWLAAILLEYADDRPPSKRRRRTLVR